jgi:hypothetical protein
MSSLIHPFGGDEIPEKDDLLPSAKGATPRKQLPVPTRQSFEATQGSGVGGQTTRSEASKTISDPTQVLRAYASPIARIMSIQRP